MKILGLLALLLTISAAFALTTEEEAILLNQELEYLQDSTTQKELQIATQTLAPATAVNEDGKLEDMYFNNEDSVSSRASATRRRRSAE